MHVALSLTRKVFSSSFVEILVRRLQFHNCSQFIAIDAVWVGAIGGALARRRLRFDVAGFLWTQEHVANLQSDHAV
jgi:hypothetical protein